MTSIRTNCPRCGEVEMRAEVILLTLQPDSDEGSYSFVCPVCENVVEKPADRKVAELLRSIGVGVADESGRAPPLPRPAGPPLTLDDVIDFHFLLQQEDWFERLAAAAS